jgi:predicted nucleic acid-binding Zn ribbon protein
MTRREMYEKTCEILEKINKNEKRKEMIFNAEFVLIIASLIAILTIIVL